MYVCVCVHVHACVCVCQVLELEDRKGEWGFKALKQMMKILFRKVTYSHMQPVITVCACDIYMYMFMYVLIADVQGDFEEMKKRYKQLLTYIKVIIKWRGKGREAPPRSMRI